MFLSTLDYRDNAHVPFVVVVVFLLAFTAVIMKKGSHEQENQPGRHKTMLSCTGERGAAAAVVVLDDSLLIGECRWVVEVGNAWTIRSEGIL